MPEPRRFFVYMDRLEADPYKLIWCMREALPEDGGWGSRLHAGWYSIDYFDEQGRLAGYLGDHCSAWVRARNVETALRIGMKRIYVEMNHCFVYPWDKFTHVFEWEQTCPHWEKYNGRCNS